MNAVAESAALRTLLSKPRTSGPIGRAMLNSLCLHAVVLLLLLLNLRHHQYVSRPTRVMAVIALNSPLHAPPAPDASSPHTAQAVPRRRHHSSGTPALASLSVREAAPTPALQPTTLSVAGQVAVAPEMKPMPSAAPMPSAHLAVAAVIAEGGDSPPLTTGDAQPPQSPPLAYLIEVSQVIRVYLDDQKPHAHGLAVVHIRIARDGTLLGAGIVQSSGSKSVDEKALGVILGIHRFPEPPSAYVSAIGEFSIDQPIRFLG